MAPLFPFCPRNCECHVKENPDKKKRKRKKSFSSDKGSRFKRQHAKTNQHFFKISIEKSPIFSAIGIYPIRTSIS